MTPQEINPTDTYIIVFSDFQPSKKIAVVKKIKETFPEVLFPSVDFNIKGVSELSEVFNNYIYIKVVDKKRHHTVINTLRKGLSSNEFKPIGTLKGAELAKFFTNYKEDAERLFKPGDYIQVRAGEFSGAKFPVQTVDKDKVYCSIQILSFQKTLSFDISNVQATEVEQLPPNPFINYEKIGQQMKQRTAIVIDGTFLMFRSVFRHSNLFAKLNTKFVGAAYGFYLTLIKLKTIYPEAEIFVVFDSKNKTK
jgi:transcription antitermination factor NusG